MTMWPFYHVSQLMVLSLFFFALAGCSGTPTKNDVESTLMYGIDDLIRENLCGFNVTEMRELGFDRAINWPGVYDFVNNSALFNQVDEPHTCYGDCCLHAVGMASMSRDDRIKTVLRLIDPQATAYMGQRTIESECGRSQDLQTPPNSRETDESRELSYPLIDQALGLLHRLVDYLSRFARVLVKNGRAPRQLARSVRWCDFVDRENNTGTFLVGIEPWIKASPNDPIKEFDITKTIAEEISRHMDERCIVSWTSSFDDGGAWVVGLRFLRLGGIWTQSVWDTPWQPL